MQQSCITLFFLGRISRLYVKQGRLEKWSSCGSNLIKSSHFHTSIQYHTKAIAGMCFSSAEIYICTWRNSCVSLSPRNPTCVEHCVSVRWKMANIRHGIFTCLQTKTNAIWWTKCRPGDESTWAKQNVFVSSACFSFAHTHCLFLQLYLTCVSVIMWCLR